MYPLIIPAVPTLDVFINDFPIGLLQEYEVTTTTDVVPLYTMGRSSMQGFQLGARHYRVILKRLILDRDELPAQYDPYGLTNFTLVLRNNLQSLRFDGCQWSRIRESYKLGETVAEELELVARFCTRIAIL